MGWTADVDGVELTHADDEVNGQRLGRSPANEWSPPGEHWGFVFADEMVRDLGPTPWLVDKLIPEDCTAALYGQSGCLKSFVMLDMALSIAHGVPWHGKATKRRSVYYLAGEGRQGFAKRIAAWCQDRELPAPSGFAFRSIPSLQDDAQLVRLIEAIGGIAEERGQAGLIVIDTLFTALSGGDENSGKDMGRIIAAMVRIREQFGATVIAVHHTGKQGDGARGHSSLASGMDVMLFARPGPAPLTVEITNLKQKDGAEHPPMLLQAFTQEVSIIGEDGDPESSLVLRAPMAPILEVYASRTKRNEQSLEKARAARRQQIAARHQIKAHALQRFAEGATLESVQHEIEALAESLGCPALARKKSVLSDWRKAAGL